MINTNKENTDIIEINLCDIIDFLNKIVGDGNGWNYIADAAINGRGYAILDDMQRILEDGYDPENCYDEEVAKLYHNATKEEFKRAFDECMSEALAGTLQCLGEDIKNGNFKLTYKL